MCFPGFSNCKRRAETAVPINNKRLVVRGQFGSIIISMSALRTFFISIRENAVSLAAVRFVATTMQLKLV